MTKPPIVFIHGLFQNPVSWREWQAYFSAQGYTCHAPAYPYHGGEPATLRANPDERLRQLTYGQVIDSLIAFIQTLPAAPILIGHSMGGLAVQTLVSRGLGVAGVCIDPAPPRGIVSFKWSFVRANLATVNPLKGNTVCLPSLEWFHYAFCNTMTIAETRAAYEAVVVPESRNIPRSILGRTGAINFSAPHAPLLFIAGQEDTIIPQTLVQKNAAAYTHPESQVTVHTFPGRGHFICGQEGWDEVVTAVDRWLAATITIGEQ